MYFLRTKYQMRNHKRKSHALSHQVRYQEKAIRLPPKTFLARQFHDEFTICQSLAFCLTQSKSRFVSTSKIDFSLRNSISKPNSHKTNIQNQTHTRLIYIHCQWIHLQWEVCHNDHTLTSPGPVHSVSVRHTST